jgi:hypothetical protein
MKYKMNKINQIKNIISKIIKSLSSCLIRYLLAILFFCLGDVSALFSVNMLNLTEEISNKPLPRTPSVQSIELNEDSESSVSYSTKKLVRYHPTQLNTITELSNNNNNNTHISYHSSNSENPLDAYLDENRYRNRKYSFYNKWDVNDIRLSEIDTYIEAMENCDRKKLIVRNTINMQQFEDYKNKTKINTYGIQLIEDNKTSKLIYSTKQLSIRIYN